MAAYTHTNSLGITFYLHAKDITLRGGKVVTTYFFSRDCREELVSDLPKDYEVHENLRNGLLIARKRKEAH